MTEVKSRVQLLTRESQHTLATSRDPKELSDTLEKISALLPKKKKGETSTPSLEMPEHDEFIKGGHYVHFIEFLVDQLSLEWYGHFASDERSQLFEDFFLDGVHHHSFLVLCSAITQSSPSFKQNKCLSLLEVFLHCGRMSDLIWNQCMVMSSDHTESMHSAKNRILWEQLMTAIVTLPDRIANKLQDKCSSTFLPREYFTNLAKDLLSVFHKVYNHLKATKNCSLQFVSQLIGRICVNGHADTLFTVLLPNFVKLTVDDFIWCRICWRIIIGCPERSMESIMECLIKKIPWYGVMSRILGDAVLSNNKLNFLLTNKFLLLRCYDQELVPQNIIGYLADSPNRRPLVVKTLKTLLDVWGDSSAVKHTSNSQHTYLTKCILVCLSHLNDQEKVLHKSGLMQKLLSGMQSHLNSPVPKLRRLGMITAEALAKTLDAEGPQLKFEYEADDESRILWSLLEPPQDPGMDWITKDLVAISLTDDTKEEGPSVDKDKAKETASSPNQEINLDSDDDLEPYDMSQDVQMSQVKTPMYIRDCIEGLTTKENRELTEASLKTAEKLVRARPDDLKEVSVAFVNVLLHLEDTYEMDDFTILRHSAMVAATVICPIMVTQYLTTEFYDRNYNIRQRLDMLEVLAAAAQELALPVQETVPSSSLQKQLRPLTSSSAPNPSMEAEHWKEIVQRRIESKTRRFVKGRSTPLPSPVANRFAPVAGHFFFPLIKQYDSKMNTMDMLGDDFLLLGRMLYTLGIVVYSAQNSPICRQMAGSLLELVWVLRYHTEVFVRQALLFALSMVILSVPSHLLVSELQDDMLECKLWLEDIIGKDPSVECRGLATQTLMILGSVVKKELNTYKK